MKLKSNRHDANILCDMLPFRFQNWDTSAVGTFAKMWVQSPAPRQSLKYGQNLELRRISARMLRDGSLTVSEWKWINPSMVRQKYQPELELVGCLKNIIMNEGIYR